MRLIDADKLKSIIEKAQASSQKGLGKNANSAFMTAYYVLKTIDEQPTAYDVDKAVEQLEDYLFEKYCVEGDRRIDEIVKLGGAE